MSTPLDKRPPSPRAAALAATLAKVRERLYGIGGSADPSVEGDFHTLRGALEQELGRPLGGEAEITELAKAHKPAGGGKRDPLADGAGGGKRDPLAGDTAEGARAPGPQVSGPQAFGDRGAQTMLGNRGDELLKNWQTGMDVLTDRQPELTRAPGSDAPWSAAEDFNERLEAGDKQQPLDSLLGRIAGPGLRYILASKIPGLSRVAPKTMLGRTGVNTALGAGETALQASGDAPEGGGEAALEGAGDALLSPEGMFTNALFGAAGPITRALRPDAQTLMQRALERRLAAAGFTPGGIVALKQDLGDDFLAWAKELSDANFHNRPEGPIRKWAGRAGLDLPQMPTTARYAGSRAAEARQRGELGMNAVEEEATARNITTDPHARAAMFEERAQALKGPMQSNTDLEAEHGRWLDQAANLRKNFTVTKPTGRAAGGTGADVEVQQPFTDTLKSARAHSDVGYDGLTASDRRAARESRIIGGVEREQLREALPPDLKEAWDRSKLSYRTGKAGQDAAERGSTVAEIQHPQQELRDLTRATAPMQNEDKLLPAGAQLLLNWGAKLFGHDIIARHQMDAAIRQARGVPGRRAAALTAVAPGGTAEAIRREIARQRMAAENPQETP